MSFENAYRPYQPQQESSGKAVAALVLGICGLVVCPLVLSIPAVIFATLARSEIRESRGRLGGASLAQAGLVLGWIGIAIYGTLFALFLVAASSGDADFRSTSARNPRGAGARASSRPSCQSEEPSRFVRCSLGARSIASTASRRNRPRELERSASVTSSSTGPCRCVKAGTGK